jgi:maltose O-acetyltransferase
MLNLFLKPLALLKAMIVNFRYRRHIQSLINNGLKLGKNVTIMPSVWIDPGYTYLISIGDNSSLSTGVRLLAHDATAYKFIGASRAGKVEIKENCFIGENSIILPGVTIGPNVLVAAGSVVNKDIPPNSCVAGNPARFYAKFDDFVEAHKKRIKDGPVFKYSDLHLEVKEDSILKATQSSEQGDFYIEECNERLPWLWNDK